MVPSSKRNTTSRRRFLAGAAGGGLVLGLGFGSPLRAWVLNEGEGELPADFRPNAFLKIAADGAVTVIGKHEEMGQGIYTGLAIAICEELEVDVGAVRLEPAPAGKEYDNPEFGLQLTGGSTSTRTSFDQMRQAGAIARTMLIAAAARRWGVSASECKAVDGAVFHADSKKRLGYGDLVEGAAREAVPTNVALKSRGEFTRIGKPTHRIDSPDKTRGRTLYSLDKRTAGMLTAMVCRPPEFGGSLVSFDEAALRRMPGVLWAGAVPSGLAIVAEGFWSAERARHAAKVEWAPGPSGKDMDTERLRRLYTEMASRPGLVAQERGKVDEALGEAEQHLDAFYEVPFEAHAPMEPLSCMVELLDGGGARLVTGSQMLGADHPAVAKRLGVGLDKVEIENSYLGGGFGRRANPASDFVLEAVEVALAARSLGRPIKTVWTREDDLRGGWYRPLYVNHVSVGLKDGKISGWRHRVVGQSIAHGTTFEEEAVKDGVDHLSVEGAEDLPYGIPDVRVELHTVQLPVPIQWWRSVGHSNTAYPKEAMLDECAHALKRDPFDLRRELLKDHPRLLRVLETAAEKAGWETRKLDPGVGRGIAVHESFKGFAAHVVEASVVDGRPRIHRVVVAIDCGPVVNPDQVVAQMQGAAIFALSASIGAHISFKDGRVEQSNFDTFQILRMFDSPEVEVHIVDSDDAMGGIGEVGVPGLAPATCEALFQATGKRIRRLPIGDQLA